MQDMVCEMVSRGYPVTLDLVNSAGTQARPKYVHGLPSYAWNHEKQYWTEPRRYKEYRDTGSLPHELLGVPVPGANPTTRLWRNFLRTSDIPWLADHQLDSKIVLPGAGYISMAIEAIRLVTDASEASLSGYRLRDIDIRNALTVPDTAAGVEVQLCLRPCSENELDHKGWYEFEVTSGGMSARDAWIVNCRGFVSAEASTTGKTSTPSPSQVPTADKFFGPNQAWSPLDPENIWSDGRKMSLYHGPLFRNLVTCRTVGPKVVTDFRIGDVVTELERYVLHPTTLDSIIQTLFAGLADETKKDAMVVPRSIGSLFVPCDLQRLAGDKLQAFTDIGKSDRRGALADIKVVNGDEGSTAAVLGMKDLYCQSVPREDGANQDAQDMRMCAKMNWELDVLHKVPSAVKDRMRINLDEQETDFERRLLRVSYNYISEALVKLQGIDVDALPWHLKIFYSWMRTIDEQGRSGQLAKGSHKWSTANMGLKQSLADALAAENAAGRLTCRVGQNVEAIVRQQVVPIEMMLEDDLLHQYYADIPRLKNRAYKHLHEVLEMYAIKQPAAKVLEVGAGTGGATAVALDAFAARSRGGNGTLLGSYHYSDVSAGFFEPAKEKFAAWTSVMDFKVLDIGSATKDATLYVPRFYPDNAQDKASSTVEIDPEPERQRFWQAGRPLVWETRKSGLLSNLYFTDKPELELLPAGKIEIEPKAFGLNFRDVLVGLGQLDETFIGHECAGVVTRLGTDTEASGLKVGDGVCGVMTGRFGNVVHAYWTGVTTIPESISWEEAASIPLIYSTSWIALFDIARVQKGERVLIHAGTGGVGQSAIMLAQWAGAEVFVTCGTPSKRQFLRKRYHIPDDHIFSSRDTSFGPAIMEATQGLGVDIVVNSLAGPLLKTTWDCIAEFGRFVEIGKVDIEAARRLNMSPFGRCALIAGVDLLHYNEHRGSVLHNWPLSSFGAHYGRNERGGRKS